MSAETQKPWEMNQKEYEQWYQDNMGEKDNIPYSERVSQWKKQGKLSLILGKPILDKSPNNDIMTSSEGKENDNDRRGRDLQGQSVKGVSTDVRGTEPRGHMAQDDAERTGQDHKTQGVNGAENS